MFVIFLPPKFCLLWHVGPMFFTTKITLFPSFPFSPITLLQTHSILGRCLWVFSKVTSGSRIFRDIGFSKVSDTQNHSYHQGRAKSGTLRTRFFLLFGWRSRVWSRFLATLWWRQDFLLSFFSKRFFLAFRSEKVWWRSRSFWSHTLTQDLIFVARTLLLQDWFFQVFVLIGTCFQQKIALNVGLKLGLWTLFVDCLLEPTNNVFMGYWIFQKQLPFKYWGNENSMWKCLQQQLKRTCGQCWSFPYQRKYLLPSIQTNLKAFWGKDNQESASSA